MTSANDCPAGGPVQLSVTADDTDIRLDRWFKRHRPEVPHALLARWVRGGMVRVDGRKAVQSARLSAGQVLTLPPPGAIAPDPDRPRPARRAVVLDDTAIAFARSLVLHRDASALVLNKPPGLATQGGTRTHDHIDGLLDALIDEAPVRPKLVHRLDKDTSGVLLIARSHRSAAWFAKAFAARGARKIYLAIVMGVPAIDAGEIDLALAKQPGTGGEKMHVDPDGQSALTRYRVIDRAGNEAALVALFPLTGRTHQLRVHMAAIGHPIVGDGKYGGKLAFLTGSISRKLHLHARRLRIDHPEGGKLEVAAPLPDHFAASVAALGFDLCLEDAATAVTAPKAGESKTPGKAKALAHSKQLRKARRGERRSRGTAAPSGPTARPGKPPARGKAAGAKTGAAKPVGNKVAMPAKPSPRKPRQE